MGEREEWREDRTMGERDSQIQNKTPREKAKYNPQINKTLFRKKK